jgi:hypothetical protein
VHGADDREPERLGELPVALVLPGHRHDRAGAVAGQDVVGDEDGDLLTVHRVHRERSGEHPGLDPVLLTLEVGHGGRTCGVVGHGIAWCSSATGPARVGLRGPGVGHELADDLGLRRHHHVGRAEQGVGACGEHVDHRIGVDDRELDLGTARPADPVALHQLAGLGPVDSVEVVDEAVGVGGDAQLPLTQAAPEHREVAALAPALGRDLLVGQHGAQARAPVDRRLVDVREPVVVDDVGVGGAQLLDQLGDRAGPLLVGVIPGVEQLQEDPLRPADEVRVDGGERASPVVRQAEPPELALHRDHVLERGLARVAAGLDGVDLRREAEGVVAKRVQHVRAGHALVATDHVGGDVAERVADVESRARGVREHVHDEVLVGRHLRPLGCRQVADRVRRLERSLRLPPVLPAQLDVRREVAGIAVRGDV